MDAKRFGILGNPAKAGAKEKTIELLGLLQSHGVSTCYVSSELAAMLPDQSGILATSSLLHLALSSDIIFSLGGDGTMLSAARAIIRANPLVELIGINLGKLGFIAENAPSDTAAIIEELWDNKLV